MHKLIFFNKNKYNIFHKKYKFSQIEVNDILSKIKNNLPYNLIQEINIEFLKQMHVKFNLPIYVEFAKNIDFNYAKNLLLAYYIFPYNLVICYDGTFNKNKLESFFNFAIFVNEKFDEEIKILKNLSVNYNQTTNKNFYSNKNEIFINNQSIKNLKMENYCLKYSQNDMLLTLTYFNGQYLNFKNNFQNNNLKIKKIIKNKYFLYFLIKKINNFYFLFNIITKEKFYLCCNKNIKKINLIKSDNGKNVLLIIETTVDCGEKIDIYFGKSLINVFAKNLTEKISKYIQEKMFCMVKCEDKNFENFFNLYLPSLSMFEKIIEEKSEDYCLKKYQNINEVINDFNNKKISASFAYFSLRNMLFSFGEKSIKFNGKFLFNTKLEMWFRGRKKTINFKHDKNSNFIFYDGVAYENLLSISYDFFSKQDNFDINLYSF